MFSTGIPCAHHTLAISADSRWLVTGGGDNTPRLWDLSAKDPAANAAVSRGHGGAVHALAISPDNRWLVTGSEDKTARLWDLSAKDPAANPVVLRGHDGAVDALAISPDNRWLVTVGKDNTARLWDLSAKDPAAKAEEFSMPPLLRNQVFISYSHEDIKWREDLEIRLKPYLRVGSIISWSDEQISSGSQWFEEINSALINTSVAVL